MVSAIQLKLDLTSLIKRIARKAERDDETGDQAPGENVSAPRRHSPALPDEGLRLLRRSGRTFRPRRDPAFRIFQGWR